MLRGVNVGGSHKLPMATLRAALVESGCTDVETYIQSGNVILTPPSGQSGKDIAGWLEGVVTHAAGFRVPVVVRTRAELERTIAGNPYPHATGTQLHVVFFGAPPPPAVLDGVDVAALSPEECELVGKDLYLHLPNGMGRAKLPVELAKAGRRMKSEPGTARNWNTVLKLVDLTR